MLTLLTPGAVADVGDVKIGYKGGFGNVAVNGVRGELSSFQVDGTRSVDEFWGGMSFEGFNLDDIAEFKVTSNNYSAAQEGGSSSLTQIVTKSGTNEFRGTAFEFLGNDAFDARNFFSKKKPPLRQNEFGGVLGGPIRKNKTFFFGEYTGFRSPSGSVSQTNVPTAEQRKGIIDVVNPVTHKPDTLFVPIDPRVQSALQLYPMPNNPAGPFGVQTYTTNTSNNLSRNQYGIKLDNNFSTKDILSGRYDWATSNTVSTSPFGSLFNFTTQFKNRNLALSETHILSPSATNLAHIGIDRFVWNEFESADPTGGDKNSQIAIEDGSVGGLPGGTGIPIDIRETAIQAGDDLTFIRGRQTLQTGASIIAEQDNGCGSGPAWGLYQYFPQTPVSAAIPTASGTTIPAGTTLPSYDGFVNFLLANPTSAYVNFAVPGTAHPCTGTRDLRRKTPAFYFQDDIHVSHKLVLNLGLRYEYSTVIKDARRRGTQLALNAATSPFFTGTPAILVNPHPQYIAHRMALGPWGPHFGFAYRVREGTVVRGGGAIRSVIPPFAALSQSFRSFPYFAITTISHPTFNFNGRQWVGALLASVPPVTTPSGQPVNLSHPAPNTPISLLPYVPIVGPQIITNVDPNFQNGYIADWSLTVEHQLSTDVTASVAYVGDAGVGLMAMEWPFGYSGTRTVPILAQNGILAVDQMANNVHSTYHGLQASLRKVSSRWGSTFDLNYAYSKAIDDGTEAYFESLAAMGVPQDPFKRKEDLKGPAPYDTTHRFVFDFVQRLPVGKLLPSLPSRLVQGWDISGILQAQTGLPFTISSGRIIEGRGYWVRFGTGGARPDKVGSIAPPPGSDRTVWFNPSAFSAPVLPDGFQARSGTLGRNTMRASGLTELDFGLHKDTIITEKVGLQFRVDAANVLNNVNFGFPNYTLTSPNFGRIGSAAAGRTITLSLKLHF